MTSKVQKAKSVQLFYRTSIFAPLGVILLTTLDLVTKIIAQKFGRPLYNLGVSFSMFSHDNLAIILMVITFTVGALILVAMMIFSKRILKQKQGLLMMFSLMLISAGAFGNSIDRFINFQMHSQNSKFAYVTDFIYYPNLFTGNIADIYVVGGSFILMILMLKYKNATK